MASRAALAGKRALVTGGGQGIGRSICLAFARAGADVAVCDINRATAQETARQVRALGRQVLALVGDAASKVEAQRWVQEMVRRLGGVDILVNNAGWRTRHPFLEYPEDELDRIIAVTLKATFLCSQVAAQEMVQQHGGRIINISAAAADRANVHTSADAAAKGGVNSLTYVMATELAPFGITVNAIAPGFVDTPFQRTASTAADLAARLGRTPLGRLGRPDEVAAMAVYLASDAAAWVTGAILRIDGGFVAAGVFPEAHRASAAASP